MSEAIRSFRDLRVYQASFRTHLLNRYPGRDELLRVPKFSRDLALWGLVELGPPIYEMAETQHWIDTAYSCEYITRAQQEVLMAQLLDIGGKLGNMISKPEKFCHHDG